MTEKFVTRRIKPFERFCCLWERGVSFAYRPNALYLRKEGRALAPKVIVLKKLHERFYLQHKKSMNTCTTAVQLQSTETFATRFTFWCNTSPDIHA